jgi:hypothetical protein
MLWKVNEEFGLTLSASEGITGYLQKNRVTARHAVIPSLALRVSVKPYPFFSSSGYTSGNTFFCISRIG